MHSPCRINVLVTSGTILYEGHCGKSFCAYSSIACAFSFPAKIPPVWLIGHIVRQACFYGELGSSMKVSLVPRGPPRVCNVEIKFRAHRHHADMTMYFDSPGLQHYTVIEHYLDLKNPMRRIVGCSGKSTCKVVFDCRHYPELFTSDVDLIMYHQSACTSQFGLHRLVKIAAPRWASRRAVRKR